MFCFGFFFFYGGKESLLKTHGRAKPEAGTSGRIKSVHDPEQENHVGEGEGGGRVKRGPGAAARRPRCKQQDFCGVGDLA